MKNLLIILSALIFSNVSAQRDHGPVTDTCPSSNEVPLRTFTEVPEDACYYLKDTNNELPAYEGTWKGTWNNRTILITFKKVTKNYNTTLKYFKDYLIAKFIVKDNNGTVLFDNINLVDYNAKIYGSGFRKIDNKYSLIYIDPDLCDITGSVRINFTDASKTKLEWKYFQDPDLVETSCFYHGLPESQRPDPLPKNVVLIKQ
ncbi:DUF6705 family protein [Chryseobacterium proteolyticum]|uniref:DUF6705 family protein n=1 Tax=Chryseobacterium proteolyticum TaxID=118127 RepID=UPI0039838E26